MKLVSFSQISSRLTIEGLKAQLQIMRLATHESGWRVDWKIQHPPNEYQAHVVGRVLLNSKELSAAFDLSDGPNYFKRDLHGGYKAESGKPGKYIRWKNYLNIPDPGTGFNGSPSISIYITKEMQSSVSKLIG